MYAFLTGTGSQSQLYEETNGHLLLCFETESRLVYQIETESFFFSMETESESYLLFMIIVNSSRLIRPSSSRSPSFIISSTSF